MKYAGLITRCLAFFVDCVMILSLQLIAVLFFSFLFGLLMPIIPNATETVTDTFIYLSDSSYSSIRSTSLDALYNFVKYSKTFSKEFQSKI